MAKCEQRCSQGDPVSRQPPPVPDSRGDRGRGVSGGAPVVREDHWWARHWVGVGSPLGMISSPSSSAPPEGGIPASGPTASLTTVVSIPSSSSSTGPPTYCTATKEGRGSAEAASAEIQARLSLLPANLLTFLKKFKKDNEKCAFYPSQIPWLEERGCPKLTVNFDHLLQDKSNWDLACTVCNYQKMNSSYLKAAARDFFIENKFEIAEPEIVFENLPRRIHMAKDFLLSSARAKSVPIFDAALEVTVATTHGRRACDAILNGVIEYLLKGVSWRGQLKLDDIVVIEGADGRLKLMITRLPSIDANASRAERLTDLKKLWADLEPHYLLDGKLPLYFEELKDDIEEAVPSYISSHWYHVYLRFHPVFYSSLARSNFICRVHHDFRALKLRQVEKYRNVIGTASPVVGPEWRKRAKDDASFSRPVYYHKWRHLPTDEEKEEADSYENTLADLLDFYRHCVQHVDENATISDVDENELFAASRFSIFLPHLIKMLLKNHLLSCELESAWSNYQVSKNDRKGPPATRRAVTAEGAT